MGSRIWTQNLQLLRELLQNSTTALGISNLEKLENKFSEKNFFEKTRKKNVKSRKKPKDLSSHNWKQNPSQFLQGLKTSKFEEKKINFLKIVWKITKKTSYLENYKDLSSHSWRQDSQHLRPWEFTDNPKLKRLGRWNLEEIKLNVILLKKKTSQKNVISRKLQELEQSHSEARIATLRVPSQIPTTGLRSSQFLNFLKILSCFENFWKNHKKTSYLENYMDLKSKIWRQNLQPLRLPWHPPNTGLRISNFHKLLKINYKNFFEKMT